MRSDRYEGQTIEDLRAELAAKTGENVRDRPLRAVRRRRGVRLPEAGLPAAPCANGFRLACRWPSPVFNRVLLKLSGEALMGSLDYGTDPDAGRADRGPDPRGRRARGRDGGRRRRRKHLSRPRGGRPRHGPGDRRLHGDARHGAQRADPPGRAREARRPHPGAVGDPGHRGRRALHPPPRDPPPREGPDRDLRGRHGEPVLHHRHGGGAARPRDPRRGDPDGQARRRGRL